MTNENTIIIKSQQKKWFIKGVCSLLMMLVSIFLALLPLVSTVAENLDLFFYIAGFSLFIGFTVLFVIILYKECKPSNAIKFNAHGFIDYLNVGDNIEIEWTNVSAIKMLGKENLPFLGISLENPEMVLSKMKKNMAAEMRDNIEQNLPAILIPQNTIRISIKELKSMFIKFTREARAIETDSAKKTKNNPFSTDDVLRAFGQLPKENEENKESKESEIIDDKLNVPFEIPEEIVNSEESNTDYKSASDSFYESLRAKASILIPEDGEADTESPEVTSDYIEETVPSVDSDESEMPEDMKDLLSKAKSSKINELEKILNDSDIPYSLSRSNKNDGSDIDVKEADSDDDDDNVDIMNIDINIEQMDPKDNSSNMETELEELLANALKNADTEEGKSSASYNVPHADPNGDTKEFIINLPKD